MASPSAWLDVLSWIKALFDVSTLSADVWLAYEKHHSEPDTRREAQRVSVTFSTYSEREIEAMIQRLENCRDRFIAEGSGKGRNECFCSVLEDFKAGNGGVLPPIDDWKRMYEQMCGR